MVLTEWEIVVGFQQLHHCTSLPPVVVLGAPSGSLTNWDGSFHWIGLSAATWYYLEVQTGKWHACLGWVVQ